MFVDADAHVDECEDTWAAAPEELRPVNIALEPDHIPPYLRERGTQGSHFHRFWFMDGELRIHPSRRPDHYASEGARELTDMPARIRAMDDLDLDVQIVYPSMFLDDITRHRDLEIAMTHSYNSWLAARSAESNGRFTWAALLPYGSIPRALEEMRWAHERGAKAIFKRAIDWDLLPSDEYFYPIYELAQELNLAAGMHASTPYSPTGAANHFSRVQDVLGRGVGTYTMQIAFSSYLTTKMPERFPNLRIGFIEASSTWIPHVIRITGNSGNKDVLKESRFYVTVESDEDLPYLINLVGDDNLIVGTDWTHGDRSSVQRVHSDIMHRSDIDEKSAIKMTSDNGRAFYAL